jgi:hypothetical protein
MMTLNSRLSSKEISKGKRWISIDTHVSYIGRTYTLRNYFDTFTEDESSHMYGITQGDVIDIFDSFRNDIIAKAHSNNCNSIHFKSHGINLYVVFEASQINIQNISHIE